MRTLISGVFKLAAVVACAAALGGCSSGAKWTKGEGQLVFSSPDRQLTGVAVSQRDCVFVNYPRWHEPYTNAVEEVTRGKPRAYPDAVWNSWKPGEDPSSKFVCVQSVHVDDLDRLWILDPGSPQIAGVVPGAAKLVCVDLKTDRVERVYRFNDAIAPKSSYLNDVRVDTRRGFAYMTDSGVGGLVVLNLSSGEAKRVLSAHPVTLGEEGVVPVVQGVQTMINGTDPLVVNSDGLALSNDGEELYFQALTARTLYRVRAEYLRGEFSDAQIAERVENLGRTVVTDGMEIDSKGSVYFSALEQDAIVVRSLDGTTDTLAQSDALAWPDSFAWSGSGEWLYVTTSRIHQSAWFDKVPRMNTPGGKQEPAPKQRGPFEVYVISPGIYCGTTRR